MRMTHLPDGLREGSKLLEDRLGVGQPHQPQDDTPQALCVPGQTNRLELILAENPLDPVRSDPIRPGAGRRVAPIGPDARRWMIGPFSGLEAAGIVRDHTVAPAPRQDTRPGRQRVTMNKRPILSTSRLGPRPPAARRST